jgi:hypothetical protein
MLTCRPQCLIWLRRLQCLIWVSTSQMIGNPKALHKLQRVDIEQSDFGIPGPAVIRIPLNPPAVAAD